MDDKSLCETPCAWFKGVAYSGKVRCAKRGTKRARAKKCKCFEPKKNTVVYFDEISEFKEETK